MKILLIDRDNDKCKKVFEKDQLVEAAKFAQLNGFTASQFYFQQWDGEENSSLMCVSVNEVIESIYNGELPRDLSFF